MLAKEQVEDIMERVDSKLTAARMDHTKAVAEDMGDVAKAATRANLNWWGELWMVCKMLFERMPEDAVESDDNEPQWADLDVWDNRELYS